MMKEIKLVLGLAVSLLLLMMGVQADYESEPIYPCTLDDECLFLVSPDAYCNLITATCFIQEGTLQNILDNVSLTTLTSTTNTTVTIDPLSSIQTRLNTLESGASLLQQQVAEVSQKVDQLNQVETRMTEVESKLDQFNNNLQSVNYQQEQSKEELRNEVNKAVTGLAVLQENLNQTQVELNQVQEDLGQKGFWLKFVSYVFLTLVVITAAIFLAYYINVKKKRESQFDAELTPSIHAYLTQQIRLGKKFPQIKDNLMQTGWTEEEARWAYKETMRHNYDKFINKSVPKEAPSAPKVKLPEFNVKSLFKHDATKVLSILIVSTLLILGALLILRGVTTGKAIYVQQEDLDNDVRSLLEKNFITSVFYEKISFADLCVQVEENGQSTSYRLLKTNLGYSLQKSSSCDNSNGYDFAFKFTNYAGFSGLMEDLSCANIRSINLGEKKALILPSKYILPGFTLNPERNLSKFCDVLKECASAQELQQLGIGC